MKRLILFLLFLGLGLILFWAVFRFVDWLEIKSYFLEFALWQGALLLVLALFGFVVDGWRWGEILKKQNISLSLFSLWKITLASFPIRFFLPLLLIGGDISQAYFLNKKHLVPWADGLASVVVNKILIWTANLVVVSLGLFYFFFAVSGFSTNLFLVFGGGFFVFAVMIFIFYFNTFRKKSFLKSLTSAFPLLQKHNGLKNASEELAKIEKLVFDFFGLKRTAFWKCLVISFLRVGLNLLSIWFLIIFLGKRLDFLKTLSLMSFSIITAMMPIPVKLGSYEAVQGAAFKALDLGAGRGVSFAMLGRGVETAVALIGIVFLLKWFGDGLFKKIFKL